MEAWALVQDRQRVIELWHQKRWAELIPFADAVASDAPVAVAATDAALYRTLRKAITEIRVRGLAFDPQALRRLAQNDKARPSA